MILSLPSWLQVTWTSSLVCALEQVGKYFTKARAHRVTVNE